MLEKYEAIRISIFRESLIDLFLRRVETSALQSRSGVNSPRSHFL